MENSKILRVRSASLGMTSTEKPFVKIMIELASGEVLPWQVILDQKSEYMAGNIGTIVELGFIGSGFEEMEDPLAFALETKSELSAAIIDEEYNGKTYRKIKYINKNKKDAPKDAFKAFNHFLKTERKKGDDVGF